MECVVACGTYGVQLNRRRCFFNDSPVACCLVAVACGMCGSLWHMRSSSSSMCGFVPEGAFLSSSSSMCGFSHVPHGCPPHHPCVFFLLVFLPHHQPCVVFLLAFLPHHQPCVFFCWFSFLIISRVWFFCWFYFLIISRWVGER